MNHNRVVLVLVVVFVGLLIILRPTGAQEKEPQLPETMMASVGTAFTYQGRLTDGDVPANGSYNLRFYLWADENKTTLLGTYPEVGTIAVDIVESQFTTSLDFGAGIFDGSERWLQIEVNGTLLTPLQKITPTPYAIYAQTAPWSGLSGVPAGFADGTDDGITSVTWMDISNRPSGLDDGDDDKLATISCSGNQVLKYIGSDWICAEDVVGISYSAGYGLVLDGSKFNVVTDTIQTRVGNYCPEKQAVQQINQDGTVECVSDLDTVDGFEGAELEESAEIDLDIIAHTAITDAHHSRYTDGEAWAAVLINDGSGSALDADTVDGLHANELGSHFQNVVFVAKSGGDYTSVQAAIDSIIDAAADNPYLVWVAPGVYEEQVTTKPYIHLQGAGQGITILTSNASNTDFPLTEATLVITDHVSISNLTIRNLGTLSYSTAILGQGNASNARIAGVIVSSMGDSTIANHGIFINAEAFGLELQDVIVTAVNGHVYNYGVQLDGNLEITIRGGSIEASGGESAIGLQALSGLTEGELLVESTEISVHSALSNTVGAEIGSQDVVLQDCVITASDGDIDAIGIYVSGLSVNLEAIDLTVTAADGEANYALRTREAITLRGGSYTASGGTMTFGLRIDDSVATLDAYGVHAAAYSATSSNYGVHVDEGSLHAYDSQFSGDTAAIYTSSGFISGASFLGVTMLDGGVAGSGSYYCFNVYDASMSSISCP